MATALSKEMEMMEAQLNRWKEIAHEALSLRKESQSLKDLLVDKVLLQNNWIFFRSFTKLDIEWLLASIFLSLVYT